MDRDWVRHQTSEGFLDDIFSLFTSGRRRVVFHVLFLDDEVVLRAYLLSPLLLLLEQDLILNVCSVIVLRIVIPLLLSSRVFDLGGLVKLEVLFEVPVLDCHLIVWNNLLDRLHVHSLLLAAFPLPRALLLVPLL